MEIGYKEGDVVFLRNKLYLVCPENMKKLKKNLWELKPVDKFFTKVFKSFGVSELKINYEFQERLVKEIDFLFRFDKKDMRTYKPEYILLLQESRTYKKFIDLFERMKRDYNQTDFAYKYNDYDFDSAILSLISTFSNYEKLSKDIKDKEKKIALDLANKLKKFADELLESA